MKHTIFNWKCMISAFILAMAIMAAGIHAFSVSEPQVMAANIREKRVVSVMVEREDTIWTIASKFYSEECGSMKKYITEIKKCNSLENDTIYAGYPLLVPVWVSEEEAGRLQGDF